MAVSLRTFLNKKLKEKGMTSAQAKKNASKYSSISAAKKAGSLYYTNKDGKVMAAVFAEDLKKAPETSLRPKVRPKKKPGPAQGPTRRGVMTLDEKMEVDKANKKPMSSAALRKMVLKSLDKVPGAKSEPLSNRTKGVGRLREGKFKTWFKSNQSKYKKPNGSYNLAKAIKDFTMITNK